MKKNQLNDHKFIEKGREKEEEEEEKKSHERREMMLKNRLDDKIGEEDTKKGWSISCRINNYAFYKRKAKNTE